MAQDVLSSANGDGVLLDNYTPLAHLWGYQVVYPAKKNLTPLDQIFRKGLKLLYPNADQQFLYHSDIELFLLLCFKQWIKYLKSNPKYSKTVPAHLITQQQRYEYMVTQLKAYLLLEKSNTTYHDILRADYPLKQRVETRRQQLNRYVGNFEITFGSLASAILAGLCMYLILPLPIAIAGGIVNLGLNLFMLSTSAMSDAEIRLVNNNQFRESAWYGVSVFNCLVTLMERGLKKLTSGKVLLDENVSAEVRLLISIIVALEALYFYSTTLGNFLRKRFPLQSNTVSVFFNKMYRYYFPEPELKKVNIMRLNSFPLKPGTGGALHRAPPIHFKQGNSHEMNKIFHDVLSSHTPKNIFNAILTESPVSVRVLLQEIPLAKPREVPDSLMAYKTQCLPKNELTTLIVHSLISQEYSRVMKQLNDYFDQVGQPELFRHYNSQHLYDEVKHKIYKQCQFADENYSVNQHEHWVEKDNVQLYQLMKSKFTQLKQRGEATNLNDLHAFFASVVEQHIKYYERKEQRINDCIANTFPTLDKTEWYRRPRKVQIHNEVVDLFTHNFLSHLSEKQKYLVESTYKKKTLSQADFDLIMKHNNWKSYASCSIGAVLPAVATAMFLSGPLGMPLGFSLAIFSYICSLFVGFYFIFKQNHDGLADKMDENLELAMPSTAKRSWIACCVMVFALTDTTAKFETTFKVAQQALQWSPAGLFIFAALIAFGGLIKTKEVIAKQIRKLFSDKSSAKVITARHQPLNVLNQDARPDKAIIEKSNVTTGTKNYLTESVSPYKFLFFNKAKRRVGVVQANTVPTPYHQRCRKG